MNFLRIFALGIILGMGLVAGTARAQNVPAGPVQSPSPVAAQQSAAPAEDIHDIRGPISIPYAWLWVLYLIGGLAAASVLFAAWKFFHRPTTKPRLPFEIALDKLEAARQLMTDDTVREYCFTVSEIIRVYIEQAFSEKAARRTTEEFLSDLLQQVGTPLAQHRRRLEDFLGHCDLSKFARWQFSVHEMESMQESARAFILETRPRPESAKAEIIPPPPIVPAQSELAPAK